MEEGEEDILLEVEIMVVMTCVAHKLVVDLLTMIGGMMIEAALLPLLSMTEGEEDEVLTLMLMPEGVHHQGTSEPLHQDIKEGVMLHHKGQGIAVDQEIEGLLQGQTIQ